jgi:hypothetical protein
MKKKCIKNLVNEEIYKIKNLINDIEILKFIFVCWMQKELNYQCNFFHFCFPPSMSNELMMYGHTLCF